MRLWDIETHVQAAIEKGGGFLLVCYDVWDRQKGDEDGGYYYPHLHTAEAVRERLARLQLGAEKHSSSDVCEAVIDLSRVGDAFDPQLCEHPSRWLARMFPTGWLTRILPRRLH